MKYRTNLSFVALIAAGLCGTATAEPFTYQGQLMESGVPANGLYDMIFQLADSASGGFALSVDSINNVSVVDGVFTVEVDFPSALMNDSNRWMSVTVEGTPLSPRVRLRETPRALNAVRANSAGSLHTPFTISDSSSTVFEVISTSSTGTAIVGEHFSGSGTTPAIEGSSRSTSGSAVGVYGEIAVDGAGSFSAGVRGRNQGQGSLGIGVYGSHDSGGWGVYGSSPSGRGVYGFSTSGVGMRGSTTSGVGMEATNSASGTNASLATDNFGLEAYNDGTDGAGTAIYGRAGGTGVYGVANSQNSTNDLVGVYGIAGSFTSNAIYSVGVYGFGQASADISGRTSYGLYGVAASGRDSNAAYGVYATAIGPGPSKLAAYLDGDVYVGGTLTKASGSFKIDHPLDPANKYLSHSFVESPDMMNIYNGVITLDASGGASVELPDYFEALNRDFRYQLTAIGASMPGLFVKSEISSNAFVIAGGVPGGRVSWEVTGVRQDPTADAHRIIIEEDKPERLRGKYLDPAAFGLDDAHAIHPKPIKH